MKRLILIITNLFIIINISHADYHYASHAGSNTYPYASWETAAEIIDSAIYAASPYDTVYIASGDYNQLIRMRLQDSCMTFIGAGIDSTGIWLNILDHLWEAANGTVIEGMWFHQYYQSRACYYARSFGVSLIARNCKFIGGGVSGTGDSTVAENCQFYDCLTSIDMDYTVKFVCVNNFFTSNIGGVYLEGDWGTGIIENNIFMQTAQNGFMSFSEPSLQTDTLIFTNNYIDDMYSGHWLAGPYYADVSNNTVRRILQVNPPTWEDAFTVQLQYYDNMTATFRNNAITESGHGITGYLDHFPHNHLNIYFTGFWNNFVDDINVPFWDYVDTMGNINTFPMYANPDSFDVHLQAYSPLIDAGDPLILDVDGTRSDIGVFGGPGGTSYEYQDFPPKTPDGLSYRISGDSLIIIWRINHESDFWRYMVNRDTVSGFTPWAENIVAEPDTDVFVDFNWDRFHDYYYRIAAYDNQGNLSQYSNQLNVINTGIENQSGVQIPSITAIETNYPNPFNSSTTIIYAVANLGPIPAQINISIYDIQGRKVRTLVNQREEMGRHTIIWDGDDESGNELASGIYFAKITQWDVDYLSKSQKLVLIR